MTHITVATIYEWPIGK